MPCGKKLSKQEQGQILALKKTGLSNRELDDKLEEVGSQLTIF